MISIDEHIGFVEPSTGVAQKGFAIRKVANLRLSISNNVKFSKLYISIYKNRNGWRNSKIVVKINSYKKVVFKPSKTSITKFKIELGNYKLKDVDIELRIYPQGIIKIITGFLAAILKREQVHLLRDSLLISEISIDKNKILKYGDINRFNFINSEKANNINLRILGFFKQTFGLAEASRRTLKTIQCSKINVSATQIPYSGKHQNCEAKISCDKSLPKNENEIRLFHFNGDHLERLISDWGPSILDCKYKIGFWHWELPDFPEDYLQWFDLVDEVWVPSKFVFDSIAPKSSKPVQIIPLALDKVELSSLSTNRKKFNIPEKKVVFLITFDFYSILERKNPIAGIKAFANLLEENIYNNDVHLVVKVSNHHADPTGYKFLQNALSLINSENFSLINRVLPRIDMLQLMNSCDSLISLHRSEGFGLHLAEAMAMGKSVIATNWSGNIDFMNNDNSFLVDYDLIQINKSFGPYKEGNVWAEPNIEQATKKIKEVFHKCIDGGIKKTSNELPSLFSTSEVRSRILNRIKYIDFHCKD